MMTSSNYGKEKYFQKKSNNRENYLFLKNQWSIKYFRNEKDAIFEPASMFVSYNSTSNAMYYDVIAILHRIILTAMLTL